MSSTRGGHPRHRHDRHEPAGPHPRGDGPPGGRPRPWPTPGWTPTEVDLVIFGNAPGGRLIDQGCIRGQTWLRKSGLGDIAGRQRRQLVRRRVLGPPPGRMAARGRPGHRAGRRGREDVDRATGRPPSPASRTGCPPTTGRTCTPAARETRPVAVLMALNAWWATSRWRSGAPRSSSSRPPPSRPAATAPSIPPPSSSSEVTLDEVLDSPADRAGRSPASCARSFTDGAAAVVLSDGPRPGAPAGLRTIASMARRATATSTTTTGWPRRPGGLGRSPASDPADIDIVELHDATSAEELYALESLGFFKPGDAGAGHPGRRHHHRRRRGDRQPERRAGGQGPPARGHRHRPGGRAGRPAAGPGRAPARSRAPDWRGGQHRRHHRGRRRLHRNPRAVEAG